VSASNGAWAPISAKTEDLLEDGPSVRPDLQPMFQADPDLVVLKSNPRFQSIMGGSS